MCSRLRTIIALSLSNVEKIRQSLGERKSDEAERMTRLALCMGIVVRQLGQVKNSEGAILQS
jgi:hypothetical protein